MLKLIHKFFLVEKEIALNNVIIPLLNDLIYFLILLSVFLLILYLHLLLLQIMRQEFKI